MAYITGELNGSGPFYVGMDVWYSGVQDWGANTSRFDWTVWAGCWNNGWGTYSGNTQYWSCSIGGVNYNGTWTLDFRPSGSSGRRYAIGSGSTWHGHDSEGWRGGFPSSAYINTDHTSVGDGGSGDAWVDAPRIPQIPGKPGNGSISNILPTSMRLNGVIPDNRGASIDLYEFAASPVGWSGSAVNTQHGGHILDVQPLLPGKKYNMQMRARNTRGWGPWSDGVQGTTLSGIYRWGGAAWVPEEARYWDGDSWELPEFYTRDAANANWELAL